MLFDRLCQEHGIRHLLTAPYSPTTTGKVERLHKTMRAEFFNRHNWNGSAWSVVPSPAPNDASLEGVVALARDNVWAVGSMFSTSLLWHVPFALHWDGRSWSNIAVPSPTPQGGRLFDVAALSPTRVYAVGQAPGIPSLVMRWNGTSWARETSPSTGTVWDAAAVGPGTVWAVGQRGNPTTSVGRTFILRTTNG